MFLKAMGRIALGFVAFVLSILAPIAANASDKNPDTNFMVGHYGVFLDVHDSRKNTGLDQGGTVAGWNTIANSFNVTTFAQQMDDAGVSYVLFYVGQNTGFFFGGNPSYETIANVPAGSRMTTRDLMGDIATALQAKGIKMFIYVPSGPPIDDTVVANNLGFTTRGGGDFNTDWYHNAAGDTKWAQILQGWATNYGTKVSGWWLDGFYGPCCGHDLGVTQTTAQKYVDAVHAGNPHAVVAFNEWAFDNPTAVPYGDYTAGICCKNSAPTSRWYYSYGTNLQYSEIMNNGDLSSKSSADLITYAKSIRAVGGSLMFESYTDASGNLNAADYNKLVALKAGLGPSTPITPYIWTAGTGWQSVTSITVPAGTAVNLGPQPIGGTWQWEGPNGFTSSAREIDNIPLSSGVNIFNATYTNANGGKTTQAFTVTQTGGVVPGTWYTIINRATGLVLDSGGQSGNNVNVKQWSNVSSPNLQWSFTLNSNGYYTITNRGDGEVLNGQGLSTPGTALTLWTAVSSPNLEWSLQSQAGGYYTLVNHTSGLVIDGAGNATVGNTSANVNTNLGNTNQQWQIVPAQ